MAAIDRGQVSVVLCLWIAHGNCNGCLEKINLFGIEKALNCSTINLLVCSLAAQSGAGGIAGGGVTTTLLLFGLMIVTSHFV